MAFNLCEENETAEEVDVATAEAAGIEDRTSTVFGKEKELS